MNSAILQTGGPSNRGLVKQGLVACLDWTSHQSHGPWVWTSNLSPITVIVVDTLFIILAIVIMMMITVITAIIIVIIIDIIFVVIILIIIIFVILTSMFPSFYYALQGPILGTYD